MFGLPAFCYSPEEIKKMRAAEKARIEKRLENCVDWDPKMKWVPQLNLRAKSYKQYNLFPEVSESAHPNPNQEPHKGLKSPSGRFLYVVKRVPRGTALQTWYGWQTGTVVFDGPVHVPALHQRGYSETWREAPWMSLTPAEIISLRGGTKRAKGTVVVAGLGLGYQLIDVAHRKQVEKLILVEREQELVDWILPRVMERMPARFRGVGTGSLKQLHVVVGDAMEELPKLKADVALVDIFASYGNNDYERDILRGKCRDIGYIWCWGSAQVK